MCWELGSLGRRFFFFFEDACVLQVYFFPLVVHVLYQVPQINHFLLVFVLYSKEKITYHGVLEKLMMIIIKSLMTVWKVWQQPTCYIVKMKLPVKIHTTFMALVCTWWHFCYWINLNNKKSRSLLFIQIHTHTHTYFHVYWERCQVLLVSSR